VPKFKQHDSDSGSTEVQIARLSARIEQISTHLRVNRKDFSSKRGLEAVLSQRKRLLRYLYRNDR
jgi:small subunit ribosomal protein S15